MAANAKNQWISMIGLRKHLQKTIDSSMKYGVSLYILPFHQSVEKKNIPDPLRSKFRGDPRCPTRRAVAAPGPFFFAWPSQGAMPTSDDHQPLGGDPKACPCNVHSMGENPIINPIINLPFVMVYTIHFW